MRNNGPAARDIFAGPDRDLFLVAGGPDMMSFVAAVKFVMDPEFTADQFAKKVDGAAHIEETGGNPEDGARKELVPMGDGCG